MESCYFAAQTMRSKVSQSSRLEEVFGDNYRYFLLIRHKNICCDPSSGPSHPDSPDEGSQHTVSMKNKKNYHQILPLACT